MIKLKLKEIAQAIDGNLDSKYFSIDFSGIIEIEFSSQSSIVTYTGRFKRGVFASSKKWSIQF